MGKSKVPKGHPLQSLIKGHSSFLGLADQFVKDAKAIENAKDLKAAKTPLEHLDGILELLQGLEKHFLLEENVLFPALDACGIKEPPANMWMDHENIRAIMKGLSRVHQERSNVPFEELKKSLKQGTLVLLDAFKDHFSREEQQIFSVAMDVIPDNEWQRLSVQFDEVCNCRLPQNGRTRSKPARRPGGRRR